MESIKEMLDRMTDMKITDPQVLLKLYNLYRYRILDDYENEDYQQYLIWQPQSYYYYAALTDYQHLQEWWYSWYLLYFWDLSLTYDFIFIY